MSEPAKKKPPMRTVGKCKCPTCGETIPLKEQANGLAAIACSWCGLQQYARGPEADRLMREKLIIEKTASPTPAATPATTPKAESKGKPGWAD